MTPEMAAKQNQAERDKRGPLQKTGDELFAREERERQVQYIMKLEKEHKDMTEERPLLLQAREELKHIGLLLESRGIESQNTVFKTVEHLLYLYEKERLAANAYGRKLYENQLNKAPDEDDR